eukprot:TRINITY_DN29204_c0_g1_i1.p1 TRINITY_DN29204_c0_g1~~TRINITY_DN29204_c0_g1_i1.p1  ORF type:complete len:102 (+),score=4.05 TRINITY_DN29204_c0_g1_i1:86-391(+)
MTFDKSSDALISYVKAKGGVLIPNTPTSLSTPSDYEEVDLDNESYPSSEGESLELDVPPQRLSVASETPPSSRPSTPTSSSPHSVLSASPKNAKSRPNSPP